MVLDLHRKSSSVVPGRRNTPPLRRALQGPDHGTDLQWHHRGSVAQLALDKHWLANRDSPTGFL